MWFNSNYVKPVTIGLAVAIATLSSCKCGGSNSIKCNAPFLIRSREIDAAKCMRLFQICSKIAAKSDSNDQHICCVLETYAVTMNYLVNPIRGTILFLLPVLLDHGAWSVSNANQKATAKHGFDHHAAKWEATEKQAVNSLSMKSAPLLPFKLIQSLNFPVLNCNHSRVAEFHQKLFSKFYLFYRFLFLTLVIKCLCNWFCLPLSWNLLLSCTMHQMARKLFLWCGVVWCVCVNVLWVNMK